MSPARGGPDPGAMREAIRGVLILTVILDHNDIIRQIRPVNDWFAPLTFHVAGFLMLPFLAPPRPLRLEAAGNLAVRYLVPFVAATLFYALAFNLMLPQHDPAAALGRVALALATASCWALRDATGFIALWFLPALFSTVCLLGLWDGLSRGWRWLLLLAALAVHLSIGAVATVAVDAVPLGVSIAAYILPLGLAMRVLHGAVPWQRRRVAVAAVSAVLVLASWRFQLARETEVASLVVPTVLEPFRVLASDTLDLSFLLLLLALSPLLARVPPLVVLGRYSLIVYLAHPILYKPVLAVAMRLLPPFTARGTDQPLWYWSVAAGSVVAVSVLALCTAVLIDQVPPLQQLVTPRGWRDWLPVQFGRPRPQRG